VTLPLIYTTYCQVKLELYQIRVTGVDAISFMQGQSTQRVDSQLRFHVFTDRFGKILCSFLAYTIGNDIEIWCGENALEAIQDKFQKFIISEEVEWSQPMRSEVFLSFNGEERGEGARGWWGGVRVELGTMPQEGASLADRKDLESFMKWQGVPSITDSSSLGEVINQTLLLPYAVDFKKGCFPGQEAVAKIQNLKGAAWAPVLLFRTTPEKKFPNEIKLNDKLMVQIDESEGDWAVAKALRDVRVHDLCLEESFVIKLYPRWPDSPLERAREIYHEGTECFQKGDESKALELWKTSIRVYPGFADSYEAIGVLLGRQEKFQEAEAWMRNLLEVDPDSVMAHTNLSLFLMRQDKIKEAEDHKALATVASFKSFGKQASEKRAQEQKVAQELAELERRSEMFRQVLEIDPEDALALHGLGSILMEKKDYTSALEYLLKVVEVEPKYSVAYLALGKCYQALDMKQKAQEIFTKGIAIAAQKGDLMPANEMQSLLLQIK